MTDLARAALTEVKAGAGRKLSLAIADPVRRMIGQNLIDMVDEAGYLTGDLPASPSGCTA